MDWLLSCLAGEHINLLTLGPRDIVSITCRVGLKELLKAEAVSLRINPWAYITSRRILRLGFLWVGL